MPPEKKKNVIEWIKILIGPVVTIFTGVGVCVNLAPKAADAFEQWRQIPIHAAAIDTIFRHQATQEINLITLNAKDSAAHIILSERINKADSDIKILDTRHLLTKQP